MHDSQLDEFKLLVLKTKLLTILIKASFNRLEKCVVSDNANKVLLLKLSIIYTLCL